MIGPKEQTHVMENPTLSWYKACPWPDGSQFQPLPINNTDMTQAWSPELIDMIICYTLSTCQSAAAWLDQARNLALTHRLWMVSNLLTNEIH